VVKAGSSTGKTVIAAIGIRARAITAGTAETIISFLDHKGKLINLNEL
jgi:hypothetical protein